MGRAHRCEQLHNAKHAHDELDMRAYLVRCVRVMFESCNALGGLESMACFLVDHM